MYRVWVSPRDSLVTGMPLVTDVTTTNLLVPTTSVTSMMLLVPAVQSEVYVVEPALQIV